MLSGIDRKAPRGQGRPVNVKHDARCVMGKVGERQKKTKRGKF